METSGGFLRRRMCWSGPPVLLWPSRTSCSCLGPGGSTNRFIWSTWRLTSTSAGRSRWVFGCLCVCFFICSFCFWRFLFCFSFCLMYVCGFRICVFDCVLCLYLSVHRCVGTFESRYARTSIRRCVGTSVCRYVDTSVCLFISISVRLYDGTSVNRYVGTWIRRHGYVDTSVCSYVDIWVYR